MGWPPSLPGPGLPCLPDFFFPFPWGGERQVLAARSHQPLPRAVGTRPAAGDLLHGGKAPQNPQHPALPGTPRWHRGSCPPTLRHQWDPVRMKVGLRVQDSPRQAGRDPASLVVPPTAALHLWLGKLRHDVPQGDTGTQPDPASSTPWGCCSAAAGLEGVQARGGGGCWAAALGGVCTLSDPQCPAWGGGDGRQERTPVPGRDTPPLFLEKVQQGKQPGQPGVKINPSARRRLAASGARCHVAWPHGTAGNPGTRARGRRPSRPLPGTAELTLQLPPSPRAAAGSPLQGKGGPSPSRGCVEVGGLGGCRGCSWGARHGRGQGHGWLLASGKASTGGRGWGDTCVPLPHWAGLTWRLSAVACDDLGTLLGVEVPRPRRGLVGTGTSRLRVHRDSHVEVHGDPRGAPQGTAPASGRVPGMAQPWGC